jgi:hypothetical protein
VSDDLDIPLGPGLESERLLRQSGQLPAIAGQSQTFSATALHTLTAEQAAIKVIPHHETFFLFAHRDDLDRFGRAVNNAKPTASAIRLIPLQFAAQTFGRLLPFKGIASGDRSV